MGFATGHELAADHEHAERGGMRPDHTQREDE
jgi:hypothetical protein